MAFETGGRADKFGNQYEDMWVVKQLLLLLKEDILSVTIEAIGDDERGVDVWIEHKDGTKEAQQCKARNGSNESWTVNQLKEKKIIENMFYHLNRKKNASFAFVSAIPSTLLGDLCNDARNSKGNASTFFEDQVMSRGKNVQKAYIDFCEALNLDSDIPKQREIIFDFLRRFYIILQADNIHTKQDLYNLTSHYVTGEPELIVSSLAKFAIDNNKLGSPIYIEDIYAHLQEKGIYIKNLAKDERTLPAIKKLQVQFEKSIEPHLIKKKLITRIETKECLDVLERENMLILTGDSGVGKSAILLEIIEYLKKENIIYLPLRVDRKVPTHTAKQYGSDLDLPDSPIHCLAAVSADKPAVLIIDQLDAIRWTSSHSLDALDVCKELVHEALSFKREGRDIKVIISCRKFDLKNDPEINNWLDGNAEENNPGWKKVEIGLLSNEVMVSILGKGFNTLTHKQKRLLSRPQNLYMWLSVNKESDDFTLMSAITLMEFYWNEKMQVIEKEGNDYSDINSVLSNLIDLVERRGKITIPTRKVEGSKKVLSSLKSNGIITEEDKVISFTHQSYLDYLIAKKVVKNIENGESILDWIGSKEKQSLFRREQLRQALQMTIEDDVWQFKEISQEIIYSERVRFHFKHLLLEVMSNLDEIELSLQELVLRLLENSEWKQLILGTVFMGNPSATKFLMEKGLIQKWINSDDGNERRIGFNLMANVKTSLSSEVARILKELLKDDEKNHAKILEVIDNKVITDTEEIFMIRVSLAEKQIYPKYIDWKQVCFKKPIYAIKLLEAILKSYSKGNVFGDENSGEIRWSKEVEKALAETATKYSLLTWDSLMPQLERLSEEKESIDYLYMENDEEVSVIKGVERLLAIAGQKMAIEVPEVLKEKVERVKKNKAVAVQNVIIQSYSALSGNDANVGIEWFLRHCNSFLAKRQNGFEYILAKRIIKSLSPLCSEELFTQLERSIYYYHHHDEKRLAKYYLELRKEGGYGHYWGKTQYLLLTEMDRERISKKTKELIEVLNRKFKGTPETILMGSMRTTGGFVKSSLELNADRLTDKTWLKIVQNKKVIRDARTSWFENKDGSLTETSIYQFASSLERVANRSPNRFGELALRFPKDVPVEYVEVIFRSFSIKETPQEEIENSWSPVDKELALKVIDKFREKDSREMRMAFCRMIRERDDIEWPKEIIDLTVFIAINHHDPESAKMNIYPAKWDKNMDSLSTKDLMDNSLNSVRGVAISAIATHLWNQPRLFEDIKDSIEIILTESHPGVKASIVEMLISIMKIDKTQAVEWFCQLVKQEIRVAASYHGVRFINYSVRSHTESIGLVLQYMTNSSHEDVVKKGSELIGSYYLFYNLFSEEIENCMVGSTAEKIGIISAARKNLNESRYSDECARILRSFLQHYDSEIASEIKWTMEHYDFHKLYKHIDLMTTFIQSSYMKDGYLIIYNLKKYEGKILKFAPLIIHLCLETLRRNGEDDSEFNINLRYHSTELSSLLLRLYEEAVVIGENGIQNVCLDIWDDFLKHQIGSARILTKLIDEI